MGQVKRILASRKVKPLEEDFCGIELCETIHIHLPSYRLEFNVEQFKVFAETVQKALQKWISLGKPSKADFIVLAGEHLPGKPIYSTRFEVEEQTIPTIHIHLRGLSLRPSIPDFITFAEVIQEAHRNLTQ